MKSIGVDLHKCSLTVVVLDEQGQIVERKDIPTKCHNQIREYFASYGLQCQVAVERVGFYQWFWELVQPVVGRLVLADPANLKAFVGRKAKTDRNDALLLATLLREGRLPLAYVPPEPIRQLRELVRLRHSLARSLSAARRQLRWISLKRNLPGPAQLTSDNAQKWLLAQESKLSDPLRLAARRRLDHIVRLERDGFDVQQACAQALEHNPELRSKVELLDSIPGFGWLIALTVLVETGDLARFDRPTQLSAYAGLAPRVSQSGKTCHHGHISKRGPPILRWLLQQAAWVAIRTHPQARRIWTRIGRRAGAKKATTALARKLLIYAWSVYRRNTPFQWPTPPAPKPTPTPTPEVPTPAAFAYAI